MNHDTHVNSQAHLTISHIKVWQVITLTVQNVINSICNALLVPQSSITTFSCPGAKPMAPKVVFS